MKPVEIGANQQKHASIPKITLAKNQVVKEILD